MASTVQGIFAPVSNPPITKKFQIRVGGMPFFKKSQQRLKKVAISYS
jgi:hypothetical protein